MSTFIQAPVIGKRNVYSFGVLSEGISRFLRAITSPQGLRSREGRQLLRGKLRRLVLSASPAAARKLQAAYGLSGQCRNCGACCQLLFHCPHWDQSAHRCGAYADRPNTCRMFPITPSDLADRNIISKNVLCGFHFAVAKDRKSTTELPVLNVLPSSRESG